MCRLFAQIARVDHEHGEALCSARNSLRAQSSKHPHGWGIGWYDEQGVRVCRGITPAHADGAFLAAARAARSRIVLAHVRNASVGATREVNTHPFAFGTWLFAHNGTVARFGLRHVRAHVEAEIDPRFRAAIDGDTDSERCFFLFLTRLEARLPTGRRPTLEAVRGALAETSAFVARAADVHTEEPSSCNFLVTNGEILAACRRGRTLFVAPHIATSGGLAIASEPVGAALWREVPEGGFIGTDGEHRLLECALRERSRRVA